MRRALLAGLVLSALLCSPVWAQDTLEYAVKAAYLVKFAPFIDWPQSAFSSPTAPLTICVVGNDPFGADLDRAASGQRDGDRPLVVRRMVSLDPETSCQILFAGGPPQDVATALTSVRLSFLVFLTRIFT